MIRDKFINRFKLFEMPRLSGIFNRLLLLQFSATFVGFVCFYNTIHAQTMSEDILELDSIWELVKTAPRTAELRGSEKSFLQMEAGYKVVEFVEANGIEVVLELSHSKAQGLNTAYWLYLASYLVHWAHPELKYHPVALDFITSSKEVLETCVLEEKYDWVENVIMGSYAFQMSRAGKPEEAILWQQKMVNDSSDVGYPQYVDLNNLALSYGYLEDDKNWLKYRWQTYSYARRHGLDQEHVDFAISNLHATLVNLGKTAEAALFLERHSADGTSSNTLNGLLTRFKALNDQMNHAGTIELWNEYNDENPECCEGMESIAVNSFLISAYLVVGDFDKVIEILNADLAFYRQNW